MSVTIQCPNGRRQAIKVKPNTSILEVLEEICEKQNLDPNEYELFRNNKPLDLSLTIRFANIPNNGQIDLKKANVVRKDQKVMIAMDLEQGTRQIKEFDPNQNLWDIINDMFESNPILTLEKDMEFSVVYIQKEITGENQLKETNLKSLGLAQGRAAMKLLVRPINAVKEQAFVESLDLKKNSKELDIIQNNEAIGHQLHTKQISTNVPKNEPTVEAIPSTVEETQLMGQNISTEKNRLNVDISGQYSKNQKTDEQIEHSDDVQQMDISPEDSSDESEEMLNYLGGNHSEILFKMTDLPKVSKRDFSDSFYETTKDDLVRVLNDLRHQQVVNSQPLQTKQMKEQKRREQMEKYKSTVIRICFPNDKLVFQAIFKPTDTVADVKQVISRYITSVDFHLYTVPPKRILKLESSLFDSELVPAALIHFGLNSESHQNVFKGEFNGKLSSYRSAAKIAIEARKTSITDDTNTTANTSQPSIENRRTSDELKVSNQKNSKVPKWFKTNK